MKIKLSDHMTYGRLIRFTLPSIVMMIFTSIYGVVDGFFVSNYVGKTPFAAVNLIMPFLMIIGGTGFMLGTGGAALVSKTVGEGDKARAECYFSMIVYTSAAVGAILAVLGIIFLRPVAILLGAEGELLENCIIYGRIILAATPAYMLQMEFQSFFPAAEKPHLGLAVTVASGVTNMVLDALFVAVFDFGLSGAAYATAISQIVGGTIPVIYFLGRNGSLLRLCPAMPEVRVLMRVCANGSSEFMSNISMSLVGMLYNVQLLKWAGEDGIAAYGVMMYVNMIFVSAFIGYIVGAAPIISYNYGAARHEELHGILKRSLVIIGLFSICMFVSAELLSGTMSGIFVGYDPDLHEMTHHGFMIFSFAFLLAGFAIFSSGFFTALNDGLTSALISFLRTLVFQVAAILVMPLIFGLDGIWLSIVAAEAMAVLISGLFIVAKRKKYGY